MKWIEYDSECAEHIVLLVQCCHHLVPWRWKQQNPLKHW